MSRSYSLDTKAAAQAGVANYINETGKYIGKFTRAEIVISRQNTEGVEFSFVSDDGLKADYLQLWTYNSKGEGLPSLKALNAIMACMKVKQIEPRQITVTGHDGTKTVNGFPDLMNKPIGILLQREEYEKTKVDDNGDPLIGYKFNLIAPFEASTELTAGEILSRKTEPEQLPRMVAMLKDKPMQKRQQRPAGGGLPPSSFDDMGDDIPFILDALAMPVEHLHRSIARARR